MRIIYLILFLALFICENSYAAYGTTYCHQAGYSCIKIKKGQSWQSLWPDPYQRDIVKRVNRMNSRLSTGMTIAVPNNLASIDAKDVAPFSAQIQPLPDKTIIVSPSLLAWGAYNNQGQLVKWGPISGGKDFCEDVNRPCRSKTGVYTLYEKRGPDCVSTKFPIEMETGMQGGAPMPYCMFYFEGFALHGSPQVPGYNASHGCIRLFTEDARWLNEEFTVGGRTHIVVLPYNTANAYIDES